MYFVIVGCSEVGFYLSRALSASGHEVAVIEREPERHQLLTEHLASSLCWVTGRMWRCCAVQAWPGPTRSWP